MKKITFLIIYIFLAKIISADVVVSQQKDFSINDEANYEESNRMLKKITEREKAIFLKQNSLNQEANNNTEKSQSLSETIRENINLNNNNGQTIVFNNQDVKQKTAEMSESKNNTKVIDFKNNKQIPNGNKLFLNKNISNSNVFNNSYQNKNLDANYEGEKEKLENSPNLNDSQGKTLSVSQKDIQNQINKLQANQEKSQNNNINPAPLKKKSITDFDPFSVYEEEKSIYSDPKYNEDEISSTQAAEMKYFKKEKDTESLKKDNNYNVNYEQKKYSNNSNNQEKQKILTTNVNDTFSSSYNANNQNTEPEESSVYENEKIIKVGPKNYYDDSKMINLIIDKLSRTKDKIQREDLLKRLNFYINKTKNETQSFKNQHRNTNDNLSFQSDNKIKLARMPIVEKRDKKKEILDRIWNRGILDFSFKNKKQHSLKEDKFFSKDKNLFLEEKNAFADEQNYENIYEGNFNKNNLIKDKILSPENKDNSLINNQILKDNTDFKNYKLLAYNEENEKQKEDLIKKRQFDAKEINAPIPDIVKRRNFKNQILPPNVSQKIYNKENRHLNPVNFYYDYKDKVFDSENFIKKENQPVIFSFIRKMGNNVNLADNENNTLLMYAVSYRDDELVKKLVQIGADINIKNNFGYTPLIIAAGNGDYKILYHMLSARMSDINLADTNGNTPLMYAASSGSEDCVKILVSKGANINAQNSEGFMAIHLAYKKYLESKDYRYKKIIKMLMELSGIEEWKFEEAGIKLS